MFQDYLDIDCANVAKQQEIRQLMKVKEQLEQILRDHQCVLRSVATTDTADDVPEVGHSHAHSGTPHVSAAIGSPPPEGTATSTTSPECRDIPTQREGDAPSLPDHAPGLPEQFQSQLLSRFLPGSESFGLDSTASEGTAGSMATSPYTLQQDDGEDALDERFETTIDLERIAESHVEHSYCQDGVDDQQHLS